MLRKTSMGEHKMTNVTQASMRPQRNAAENSVYFPNQ